MPVGPIQRATLTGGLLKTIFGDPFNNELFKAKSPVQRKITIEKGGFGDELTYSMVTGRPHSVQSRTPEGMTLPVSQKPRYKRLTIPHATIFGVAEFSGEAVLAADSGSEGSYKTNLIVSVLEMLRDDANNNATRNFYAEDNSGKIFGILANQGAITAGDPVKLYSVYATPDAAQLRASEWGIQWVDGGDFPIVIGRSSAWNATALYVKVTGFNRLAQTVTFDTNVTINDNTDWIAVRGDDEGVTPNDGTLNSFGQEYVGLDYILDEDGQYFGVNRSQNKVLNSVVIRALDSDPTAVAAFDQSKLQMLIAFVDANSNGDEHNFLSTTMQVRNEIFKALGEPARRYVNTKYDFGFEAVDFNGKPVVVDTTGRPGSIYYGDMASIVERVHPNCNWSPILGSDGSPIIGYTGGRPDDTASVVIKKKCAMLSLKPNRVGRYTGIGSEIGQHPQNN